MTPQLEADVQVAEGLELEAYPDPQSPLGQACARHGFRPTYWRKVPDSGGLHGAPWTIGYGHTGPEVHPGLVWTKDQALAALKVDLAKAAGELDADLAWWRGLDDVRQDAMAELAFNMGVGYPAEGKRPGHGLRSFVQTLSAIRSGRYAAAADGLAASAWAREVGDRAERIEIMIRTGKRP